MKLSERITISMLNGVTMKINIDEYLLNTLKEDITSEDVSTNAVMPDDKQGKADLICKQNGVICGLDVLKEHLNSLTKQAILRQISRTAISLKRATFWALFTAM